MLRTEQFKKSLQTYLSVNPGTPARRIAKDLSETWPGLSKRDINPILYRERDIFRSQGYTPPIWFLIATNPLQAPAVHIAQPIINIARRIPVPQVQVLTRIAEAVIRRPEDEFVVRDKPIRPVHIPRFDQPLFRWQREAIVAWKDNDGKGVIEAVTGTGKTRVAIYTIRYFINKGHRSLILVPSVILFD